MKKSATADEQNNAFWTLAGPSLSIVLAALGISSAAVTLPEMSLEFQDGGFDPTLVVSIYILATTALIVPLGRAGDFWGKRTVLVLGLCVYGLGALLAFQTRAPWVLIFARFVQGIGAAAMLAMPLALVRENIPTERVGRWMGAMGTMSAIGTASGPALGGAIAAIFEWRTVYLLQIPAALIALLFCLIFIRNRRQVAVTVRFDILGSGALVVFLAAFTLAVSDIADGFDLKAITLFGIAAAALLGFLFIETRASAPIIPMNLLRSSHLKLSLVMNAMVSLVMMGILVVGPFFLIDGLKLTTAQMGIAMSVGPISSALSGVPAGRLTEWIGSARAVVFGAIAMAISTAAMAVLPYMFGISGFVIAFVLLPPSYQLFLAALNTSVMENVSTKDQGVTAGIVNLARNFGFIVGAGAISGLYWSLVRLPPYSADEAQRVGIAMAGTFAISCAISIGVALLALLSLRNAARS
jgi:MFS family permease